jgi:16S rRNA processing protein RimM
MAEKTKKGSPAGEPLYLSVAFLRRPHGVHGEIIMDLHTDFPERMKKGRKIFVGDEHKPMTFESVRPHAKGLLVKLKGVDTLDEAGLYRNQWVFISEKDAPALPEGQFYKHELLGLNVIDEKDDQLGKVVDIIETGANDVYVVRDDSGREILLPAISSVILDLQPASGFVRVHLLDGLVSS